MTDLLLQPLIGLSRRYGSDPAYVLAGGGNTSVKTRDRLWVKASGHALATIDESGFVELDRAKLQAMLGANWSTDARVREAQFMAAVMDARVYPELNQRPSVESLLHHIVESKFVVHTHPARVNSVTCCTIGREIARERFGRSVLWQPYVDPGLTLAKALAESIAKHKAINSQMPQLTFLQNHGLIVGADTTEEIGQLSEITLSTLEAGMGPTAPMKAATVSHAQLESFSAEIGATQPSLHFAIDQSPAIVSLASNDVLFEAAKSGPLTPDQIVYCRPIPLCMESGANVAEAWENYVEANGFEPWVALVRGHGMIAMRQSPKLAAVTRAVFADAAAIYRDAEKLGGVQLMSNRDRKFIEDWEVEAYRRSVMEKPAH